MLEDWRNKDFWIGLRDNNGWRWQGRVNSTVNSDNLIWHSDDDLGLHFPIDNDGTTCGYVSSWLSNDNILDKNCDYSLYYICEFGA